MVLAFPTTCSHAKRYVDEACADVRIFRRAQVKHIVHDAVAYVGACGEGYVARKAVFADVLNDCFDRSRCKVCGRAVCLQRLIGRLLSGVVRDSCVCKVDADFLTVTHARPPACPTSITTSGLCSLMAASTQEILLVNSVGISTFTISAPAMVSGKSLMASNAGFTLSPPNGSQPRQ